MYKSPVALANEYISISTVLHTFGVEVPESSSGTSWKSHCPFEDIYHIDRGRDKSLRVYFDTNTAYCFQGCGYITVVSLYALKTGLSQAEAASFLLASNGYTLPSVEDKLNDILYEKPSVSKASLREALQIFCSRIVGEEWRFSQFDDYILLGLDNCLRLLDKVQDESTAKLWLENSKNYMSFILKGKGNV